MTTTRTTRDWVLAPRAGRGLHLADDARGWSFHEYAELADRARRVAGALIADGVRPGDGVAVLMPTGLECLAAIFGAWVAGAALTPIAPPSFEGEDEYVERVAAILRAAATRVTVTSSAMADMVDRAHAAAGRDDRAWIYREAAGPAQPAPTGELALVQFTSGSTSHPRGVRITWDSLEANVALMRSALDWRDGDAVGSWLPLHHDMGFVGALLVPVSTQGDLWLMRPDQFIRDPLRWIRCFEHATFGSAPPFALAYAARRLRPEQLEGLDLSGWRNLIVAAEPVTPKALEAFAQLAGPAGLSRSVLRTAYGLAEATLAVTFAPRATLPRTVQIAGGALRVGERVSIIAERALAAHSLDDAGGWLVGCGPAPDGVGLRIVDDEGAPLPEGHLGEIAVRGASVAVGYAGPEAEGSARFVDGELRTGDAGFLLDGDLFVLGRMGTSLKVNGRNVFVEDIEQTVVAATGLPENRVAVVADTSAAGRGVALLVESAPGPWVAAARQALRGALGPEIEVTIVARGRGLINRTSSGKPRRRHMWELLQAGLPEGARILEEAGEEHRPMLLGPDQVRGLLEETLTGVATPAGCAIVLEGSIAEGFGNDGSDVDFLIVDDSADDLPTMPSVLFVAGRRVEVRSRSVGRLQEQFRTVQRGARTAAALARLDEDLLNRCQRFLRSFAVRNPEVARRATGGMTHERFAEVMTRWWAHQARHSLRQAIALATLGQQAEAAGWAGNGILQAAKSWAASRGETYLETKWLSEQLRRIGDEDELVKRFHALEYAPAPAGEDELAGYVRACLELAADLGVDGARPEPERLLLARVPEVTTWPTGDGLHVVRDRTDVFALGSAAARAWRQIVFGRPLVSVLEAARAATGPEADAGALIAEFLRLGLIGLSWSGRGGGAIRPAMPLVPPLRPVTPPPFMELPIISLRGSRGPAPEAVTLVPMPAPRFAEAAVTLEWSNVLIENAREDLVGALRNQQWGVATHSARRMLLVAHRVVLCAYGVVPLPPHTDLLRALPALRLPGTEAIVERARSLERLTIDSPEQGDAALAQLDEFAAMAREAGDAGRFPSSFASAGEWRRTLELAYDWLRLCAYLDSELPIDEARDLVASGGQQPHVQAGGRQEGDVTR